MGRETQLVYTSSMFEEKDDNLVDIGRINSELLGWKVTSLDFDPVKLFPNVHEYQTLLFGCKDMKWSQIDTHSSIDHISKFGGYYFADIGLSFPFIEENVLQNLSKVLKNYFISGEATFIIVDDLGDSCFSYTIRVLLKDDTIKICIEVMDFVNSISTKRIDLIY